jgi:hypothetical protein
MRTSARWSDGSKRSEMAIRSRITKNIPTLDLKKGGHLTLKVVSVSQGKKHTASIPLKV